MTKSGLLALVLVGVGVSACGSLIGGRAAPDEMAVVEGPSLAIPPDFELRPPVGGATSTATPVRDTPIDARAILNKPATPTATSDSAEDAWLIRAAGGDRADPDIRDRLSEQPEPKKRGFFSRLNPFSGDDDSDD
jgi:hypothetical protein